MSIGGWTGSRYYSKMASSSSNRSKFVKSVKRMLEASGADGIDIDWEYPGTSGAYDDKLVKLIITYVYVYKIIYLFFFFFFFFFKASMLKMIQIIY